ncbi:peroxisomal biogenesis factor 11 [Gautieria morchelliformis]|nr:peroxisomal biogenesis factor 11 [Gautieria morchelliformis]
MSSIASQVILHPIVSQSLKLWATTAGRDKTYRAVQYFARFLAWYLIRRGNTVQGARWNNLKSSLASGRKLMRLFKPLENLQAALRAVPSSTNVLEQITTIGRHLAYFGYLSYDMIVWAHSVRFIMLTPERAIKVNKTSLRFWLVGILFSIANGVFKAGRLANEAGVLRSPSSEKNSLGDDAAKRARLAAIATQSGSTRHQLFIDTLDVSLPASALGLVDLNDGVVGILGFISSVMALGTQWNSVSK